MESDTPAAPAKTPRTTVVKKKVTLVDGAAAAAASPQWHDVYYVMNRASEKLLKSLLKRDDIPPDAKEIIEAVACMKESKELFFAEGGSLTAASALMWMGELREWAAKN